LHIDQVEKIAVKLAKDKVVWPIVQRTRVLLSTCRQDENHHRLSKNKDAQDAKYGWLRWPTRGEPGFSGQPKDMQQHNTVVGIPKIFKNFHIPDWIDRHGASTRPTWWYFICSIWSNSAVSIVKDRGVLPFDWRGVYQWWVHGGASNQWDRS
jgi:hypothetical protein